MPKRTIEERFLARVQIADTGCWLWDAPKDTGYGQFWIKGHVIAAHVAAYQIFIGPVPSGLELDHLCHTRDESCMGGPSCIHRRCVNPFTCLEPVTRLENVQRSRGNSRKTHCPRMHPYDEANTYLNPSGRRQCRQCHRDSHQQTV